MLGLYDINNTLITRYVNCVPQKDAVIVKNRLLDGSYFVQSIGAAVDVLELDVYASNAAKQTIDAAYIAGPQLKVVVSMGSWTGRIIDLSSWSFKARGYYQASIKIAVSVVGGS